jgi:site-specific recombinase XerC
MEYHKTKDILHVKEILGHKNINNTLIYINLERAVFKTSNNEFTVKAVKTLEEACKLLEVGFEYVTEVDGKKIFRKRK